MGAARQKVLSFGYDVPSLKNRERQLRAAGFDVDSTSTLEDALSLAQRHRYHLAIVGHAVGEPERNRLAGYLKSSACKVPVIFLYHDSIHNAGLADAVLSVATASHDVVTAAQNLIAGAAARSADCGT